MATAGPTGQPGQPGTPTGWLGGRVLVILLVLSVVLNLCFIAGAVWIRWHVPARWAGPEQRYQQMARELDLTPEQRTGFDAYVAAMRTRTGKMRQQVAPLIGSAWEEIAKPQADGAQVMRFFDEAAEKRREFQREASAETLKFLALLTPAQRGKFIMIARQRWAPGLRPPPATH
jgi:Spy/CpxP family protein refolding chaperone